MRRIGVVLAAALVVAGCAPSAPARPPASVSATPEATPGTGSATPPAVAESPAPGAAQRPPSGRLPGQVLDLANWYLTLPTGASGDPDTVKQPELAAYSDAWFRTADTGDGVLFTADAGGATTSGSNYPRSELREMDGPKNKAAWSNTSGTHTLSVREAVLAVPPAKPEVVTAQIHDTESDVMEVRLEGTKLIAQYDDGKTDVTIDPAYRLGTPFDLRIVAADSRVVVFYNGVQKAEIPVSGSDWYFKTGCYLQSNTDKGDQPDAVAQVAISALQVTHTP